MASGRPKSLADDKTFQATASELGLRRDQVHDVRLIRDAEAADPGLVRPALDGRLARGEEPKPMQLRRIVVWIVNRSEWGMRCIRSL